MNKNTDLHVYIIAEKINKEHVIKFFQIGKYIGNEFTGILFDIINYKESYYIHNFDILDIFGHSINSDNIITKFNNTEIISYEQIKTFIDSLFIENNIDGKKIYKIRKYKIKEFDIKEGNELNNSILYHYKNNNIANPIKIKV